MERLTVKEIAKIEAKKATLEANGVDFDSVLNNLSDLVQIPQCVELGLMELEEEVTKGGISAQTATQIRRVMKEIREDVKSTESKIRYYEGG